MGTYCAHVTNAINSKSSLYLRSRRQLHTAGHYPLAGSVQHLAGLSCSRRWEERQKANVLLPPSPTSSARDRGRFAAGCPGGQGRAGGRQSVGTRWAAPPGQIPGELEEFKPPKCISFSPALVPERVLHFASKRWAGAGEDRATPGPSRGKAAPCLSFPILQTQANALGLLSETPPDRCPVLVMLTVFAHLRGPPSGHELPVPIPPGCVKHRTGWPEHGLSPARNSSSLRPGAVGLSPGKARNSGGRNPLLRPTAGLCQLWQVGRIQPPRSPPETFGVSPSP